MADNDTPPIEYEKIIKKPVEVLAKEWNVSIEEAKLRKRLLKEKIDEEQRSKKKD